MEARFCSLGDVIPRSNDIPHITARNKRTETLSTAGEDDKEEAAASEISEVVVKVEAKEGEKSRKKRDSDRVVFEEDKRPTRQTMVFRETFSGLGNRGPAHSNSRHGVSLRFLLSHEQSRSQDLNFGRGYSHFRGCCTRVDPHKSGGGGGRA